ncbi:kelch repeat-containing protein, partial [candidate division CSSED10-310 bacterium]
RNHTATLLPDGKVLVVGGMTGEEVYPYGTAYDNVDVFDPTGNGGNGSWSAGPAIPGARYYHTATLMPDGQVLVIGGIGDPYPQYSSCYLYNSSSPGWTEKASMSTHRYEHCAVLMSNGEVLVVKGDQTSCERYNYQGDTWTPCATYLIDGSTNKMTAVMRSRNSKNVLVVGEHGFQQSTRNAYQYDHFGDSWSEYVDYLVEGRYDCTATVLDNGDVLITGGLNAYGTTLSSTEILRRLQVGSQKNSRIYSINQKHCSSLLPDGTVLITGGTAGNPKIYSGGSWSDTVPVPTPLVGNRENATTTLLPNGKVLIAGGEVSSTVQNTAILYDYTAGGSWSGTGDLVVGRKDHTATLLPTGQVLVAGGTDGAVPLGQVELYDPDDGVFTQIPSLQVARTNHTATLLYSGKVLVAGGYNGGELFSSELYDPESNTWEYTYSALCIARQLHSAALLKNGKVLVAGGYGRDPLRTTILSSAELYDPTTDRWQETETMATNRQDHLATVFMTGDVLLSGGYNGAVMTECALYDWVSELWVESPVVTLDYARRYHTADLLTDGYILIAGGADVDWDEISKIYNHYGWRPVINSAPTTITYGTPFSITGDGFRGLSEASSGKTQNSAANHPTVILQSIEHDTFYQLEYDEPTSFWGDPITLNFSDLPNNIYPGWYQLTLIAHGNPSISQVVLVECSVGITTQPQSIPRDEGQTAPFFVETQGALYFQWQKKAVGDIFRDIPDAEAAEYETPPIIVGDHKAQFRCRVWNKCAEQISEAATLTVNDTTPPTITVVSPNGGESWAYSESDSNRQAHLIVWSWTDNFELGRTSLTYTTDGSTWSYIAIPISGYAFGYSGPGPGLLHHHNPELWDHHGCQCDRQSDPHCYGRFEPGSDRTRCHPDHVE